MNANPFLKEFLEMRKSLAPSGPAPADVLPKKEIKKKKAKMTKEQTVDKPGLQHIIEEKPHRRVVIDYLQHRANELSTQKMS